jgi:hypothetical protein
MTKPSGRDASPLGLADDRGGVGARAKLPKFVDQEADRLLTTDGLAIGGNDLQEGLRRAVDDLAFVLLDVEDVAQPGVRPHHVTRRRERIVGNLLRRREDVELAGVAEVAHQRREHDRRGARRL